MTTAIVSRLRRAGGCPQPWRIKTVVIETEIAVSSQVLVTPKKLRKVIQSSGIVLPEMSDSELLAEVGRALQRVEIDEAA